MPETANLSRTLSDFVHGIEYDDLSAEAVHMTKRLLLDWLGSALAGAGSRPVAALRGFVDEASGGGGASQSLDRRTGATPYFAALLNAAASHVVEQDDVHNGSVFHPATVVFPPLLALAQSRTIDGRTLITAANAGYETGIRVGEYLGRGHYRVFHTTGTAGTVAAAMAAGRLLALDTLRMAHALGSAGTQAAGLWEFLRSAADSKQLHTAKAAADGLLAALAARHGLTGAERILDGDQGMNAGMLGEGRAERLLAGIGERWCVLETSFKFHASCRHTHPAADALLAIVTGHDLAADAIASIEANVYRAALDVLGPVTDPRSVHQAKFSMGFVLALIADRRRAGVADFTDQTLADPRLRALHDRVTMRLDADVDAAYPDTWSTRVVVTTTDGRRFEHTVSVPKGDPGNPLSDAELADKFRTLAGLDGRTDPGEIERLVDTVFDIEKSADAGEALRVR